MASLQLLKQSRSRLSSINKNHVSKSLLFAILPVSTEGWLKISQAHEMFLHVIGTS